MRVRGVSGGGGLRTAAAIFAMASSTACGRPPVLTVDALPVRRVVVYRNGVAYFERAGRVDGDEVRFKMRSEEIGDFLATLAVMEHGGSSVRAAAFPLKKEEEVDDDGKPIRPKTDDEKKGLETVVLSLDGRLHDLEVGYVAGSPVWRPSYRLVVRPNGEADLQAWGIVENLSGEDWKDVRLSLIAGAPLAFEADLGTPVIPARPTVTDSGEVIAAVPHGETSLLQAPAPPPPPEAAGAMDDGENEARPSAPGSPFGGVGLARGRASASLLSPKKSAPAAPAPAAQRSEAAPASISPPRNLRSLAAVAVEGGATRYDLPVAVTVPDRSATMVLLLSRKVVGEALFLFAPDAGVSDSAHHPFRVARFANGAGGTLERGPIAVFEDAAFLGQGMLDPLPAGATATVPFALERAVAVDTERKSDELGERVAKIENAQLTIERDTVMTSKYRVRNGGDTVAKVLIKHGRMGGAKLFSPPPGTEDNVGSGSALVPAQVPPNATAEIVIDERLPVRRGCDWFSPIAENAIKAYVANPHSDADVVKKLNAVWGTRGEIVRSTAERAKLQQQSDTLSQSTEETRRNLRAIEKNKSAEALRQKLTARLAEAASKLDDLNRKLVELDARLAELNVTFREGIRDIKVVVAP